MNKPLSEWTLGEIKTECVKRNAFCKANGKCPSCAKALKDWIDNREMEVVDEKARKA